VGLTLLLQLVNLTVIKIISSLPRHALSVALAVGVQNNKVNLSTAFQSFITISAK
jgi:hypothetical protein